VITISVLARYRIRNKHGETALDLVKPGDEEVALIFRKFQADANIDEGDIACTFCERWLPRLFSHNCR
jgi:hypothetical protein